MRDRKKKMKLKLSSYPPGCDSRGCVDWINGDVRVEYLRTRPSSNYEDTIKKWYHFANLETQHLIYQQVLDNIDKHTIKFDNVSNPNLSNKSFGWLKVLIVRIVNDWLDYNLMNIYNPWYIDIDKYVKKWSNF